LKHEIQDYEINSCTMFLSPVEYGSKVYSQITEVEDEYVSPFKPLDIIRRSCTYFGVDYESRKKGTKQLIGYCRKLPIVIEPSNHIFFFPTTAPASPECIWISNEHIEKYRRMGPHQTLITFRNKSSHLFPVSSTTIETQILRTSLLKTKLMQRIDGSKKMIYLLHGPKELNTSESGKDYETEK